MDNNKQFESTKVQEILKELGPFNFEDNKYKSKEKIVLETKPL